MSKRSEATLAAACAVGLVVVSCSSDTPTGTPTAGANSGGSAGVVASGSTGGSSAGMAPVAGAPNNGSGGGSGGSGGSGAGAGASGGTGGTGGTGAGGAPAGGSAGRSATGGSSGASVGAGSGGGGAAGRDGSGGAGAAQAGSSSGGAAGMSGGSTTPKPSPGCGKGARPSGGQVEVANTSLYMFPTAYDGTKPYPLLIALHACGNPNTEFVSLTNGTPFETDYVRSFPNTPDSGQCWSNYTGDIARITSQYDDVMNNYCIDQNRVFAIAHSSGAQLLVNILSHKSDAQHLNLKGISPVAADPFNVALPMPVLYIDGQMDNQRSADSAKNTVAKFRSANSCADTSKPYTAIMGCASTDSGHPQVNPGCNIYDGCSVPTIWCSHNDPSYSGTQHGVPCFAIKSMLDFFAGL